MSDIEVVNPPTEVEFDPLKYFEGGKEGIQNSFGEIILAKLLKLEGSEIALLLKSNLIGLLAFKSILVDKDFSVLNEETILALADPLGYGIMNMHFPPFVGLDNPTNFQFVLQRTHEEGFFSYPHVAPIDRVKFFLCARALEKI